jgi:hypothetical protein
VIWESVVQSISECFNETGMDRITAQDDQGICVFDVAQLVDGPARDALLGLL